MILIIEVKKKNYFLLLNKNKESIILGETIQNFDHNKYEFIFDNIIINSIDNTILTISITTNIITSKILKIYNYPHH